MISDLEIFRSANWLIDQHGEGAAAHAAMQADTMLEKGDMNSKRVWQRIIAVIEELQRTELGPGETAH